MRKARPLSRSELDFRDDRLILIACDDTYAPKQYFDGFQFRRLQVRVVPTVNGQSSSERVLDRLLELSVEDDDERWLLLDTDHYTQGTHLASFTQTLRRARQSGVKVALSKPCFEFWLLLHYADTSMINLGQLIDATTTLATFRNYLPTYTKLRLQPLDYTPPRVADAILRATKLDQTVAGGDIPEAPTSRVFQLWNAILNLQRKEDLPQELAELLRG